jgi:indole-3-acetate monooxygenase
MPIGIETARRTQFPDPGGELLAAVRALAPRIAERAPQIESARRVPLDLVEELRRIGVFRMLAPRRFGGMELELALTLSVLEELSIADGSTGWVAMIGCHGPLFFSLMSPETFESIYADGADVIHGGSTRPQGTASAIPGGWQVKGRWSFASGCEHADWLLALCVEMKDGAPVPGSMPGRPALRAVSLPATAFRVVDNWDALGLRGSGSHDIVLEGVFVPDRQTTPIAIGPSGLGKAIATTALHLGAVAVGIAEGAIRDVAALAGMERTTHRAKLATFTLVQSELGEADAMVKAARALMHAQAREAVSATTADYVATDVAALQAALWSARACLKAVETCFALVGTHAIHSSSPLQRRLRDAHVLMQHALLQPRNYAAAGARRFGLEAHPLTMGV